jgi:hypothetical protein
VINSPGSHAAVPTKGLSDTVRWLCLAFTDCLPLGHGTTSHSRLLVVRGTEVPECGVPTLRGVDTLYVLRRKAVLVI